MESHVTSRESACHPRPTGRIAVLAALVLLSAGSASAGTGRLMVRVRDARTGRIIPARLVLRSSDGRYPGDRIGLDGGDRSRIEAHGVFIGGEGSFELPAGRTSIIAAHGAGYDTDSIELDVPSGGSITAELKLSRGLDMRALGWVGGDAHVHMIHGEDQRPTGYEDVATACRAGGLDWAYVNEEYTGAGKLDLAGYEAECRKVSTEDFRLLVGGERPKSLLGHHALIGVADPFVVPDDPPYYRAARAIHAQGGVLFNVHPVRYYPEKKAGGQWLDFPGNNLARELVFDAFLGPSFDGISVLSDDPAYEVAHRLWFNLLNRGFFVPALADSDACFDRPVLNRKAPGFWTTYLHIGPGAPVDHAALATAVREGRTMATTGPLLLFSIDDRISGSTFPPDGRPHTVEIRAHQAHHNWSLATNDVARGTLAGIARVELLRNGIVVKSWEPKLSDATLRWSVNETEPCWYAARAYGTDRRWQVALASPIYFANRPVAPKREPLMTTVRGRVYDFRTGVEREGDVEVRRGDSVLAQLQGPRSVPAENAARRRDRRQCPRVSDDPQGATARLCARTSIPLVPAGRGPGTAGDARPVRVAGPPGRSGVPPGVPHARLLRRRRAARRPGFPPGPGRGRAPASGAGSDCRGGDPTG